jgi:ribonuclease P protein component
MDAARLRRTRDIAAVRAMRPALSDRHLSARSRPNELGVARIAVAVPRDVGTAVHRNRARRRLREAVRLAVRERSGAGADILLVARKPAISAPFDDLGASVRAALDAALGPGPAV